MPSRCHGTLQQINLASLTRLDAPRGAHVARAFGTEVTNAMSPNRQPSWTDGLAFPVFGFLATGAYYFLSAQEIINNNFVSGEVRQMVGLMCLSDVAFCVLTSRVSGAKAKRAKPLTGTPRVVLWLLPLCDLLGLVCAFEAIRIAGSGFHQTVGGASIPISCALNVLITGKTYSPGQLAGISIVIAGLSVKLKVLLDSDASFPVDATALVLVSCVGYALRGICMEYLSNVKPNPPSGDRMTLQIGVCNLLVWLAYTVARTLPRWDELVSVPFAAATSRYGAGRVAALYLTHALSRGLASKCIIAVVTRGGATALSLAQVVRASVIVVLVSVAFCSTDPRQCLDGAGAASAALVVAGGCAYAVAKKPELGGGAWNIVASASLETKSPARAKQTTRRMSARRKSARK